MKPFAFLLLAVASCSSGPKRDTTREDSTTAPRIDPTTAEPEGTYSLGTERLRPVSKTIDWPDVSTPDGAGFLGGDIVVDRILREDSDNMYGIRVRLGNKSTNLQEIEYRIQFTDEKKVDLLAVHDGWRSIVIEPRGLREVTDACRVHGAIGFQIQVRRTGGRPN